MDPELKIELLIKLSFGIPLEKLCEEYDLTKAKIINLRKNNYVLYNQFFDHWRIDEEIAVLGFAPKYERAVSILKKFYKSKIRIDSQGSIYYLEKPCTFKQIMYMVDEILKKDNINCWLDNNFIVMNHY